MSLQALAEAAGIALKHVGADEWRGCCPFHDDREPSLSINARTNVFHCFGCGAQGDVIRWVRERESLSFPDAVAWLDAHAAGRPWAGPSAPAATRRPLRPSLPPPLPEDATGADLLAAVIRYYAQVLHDDPLATATLARTYLAERKLWHPEVLRALAIGFDDRSLGTRLPAKAIVAGRRMRERLTEIGVYRASGHAHFVGCITCPIDAVDDAGRPLCVSQAAIWAGLYGRRAQRAKDGIRHVNLPGERRGVWNAQACAAAAADRDGVVILTEAVLDGLTFAVHGFPNVTACLGVHGYTADVRNFLHAHARDVLIAFDRDAAAEAAFPAIADDLIAAGITVRRVQFSPDQDANAVAVAAGDDAVNVLGDSLRNAVWLGGAPRVPVAAVIREAAEEKTSATPSRAESMPPMPPMPAMLPMTANLPSSAADVSAPPATPAGAAMLALPDGVTQPSDDVVQVVCDDRTWTARGWRANTAYERLKVALRVQRGTRLCGDTIDVASLKARSAFLAAAAAEVDVPADILKDDLGRLWLALEALQDQRIRTLTAPPVKPDPVATMSPERRDAALAFLRAPDLLDRIRADIVQCGLVGESDNALVAYLAAVSRKMPDPLAVLVQASSAAGKSSVQDTVLALIPDSDRYDLTAISSRALFYAEPDALRHKALSIAEQEGAEAATYSLKLMQSAGKLSIMVPVKNPDTNEMTTQSRTVDGPVALFMTTTAAEIDDELQNRFLVLTVDESPEQTAAVQAAQRQRETLAGFHSRAVAAATRRRHHDAQHLLASVAVVNPFADRLTFAGRTPRTRRDHAKYLRLIRAITLLHQHQRPQGVAVIDGQDVPYIETTAADIAAANGLAAAVLGRSLDELAPQTRKMLRALRALVDARAHAAGKPRDSIRLTRREIREATGWSPTQVHVHLSRLVDLEYVAAHRGPTINSLVYAVVWNGEGDDGQRFHLGLTIPDDVTCGYGSSHSAPDGNHSGVIRGSFGGHSAPIRSEESGENAEEYVIPDDADGITPENVKESACVRADIVPVHAGFGGGGSAILRPLRLAPLAGAGWWP